MQTTETAETEILKATACDCAVTQNVFAHCGMSMLPSTDWISVWSRLQAKTGHQNLDRHKLRPLFHSKFQETKQKGL